jgi:hypothetical protein
VKKARSSILSKYVPRNTASSTLGLLALALGCSCGIGNQSGDLTASQFGDMSHVMALTLRVDPMEAMTQACAGTAPAAPNAARFIKRPFLQQMTDTAVHVDWIAAATPAPSVVVQTPAGGTVATVPAVVDQGAQVRGSNRFWSAPVTGLTPDTTYCYEVRAGDAVLARAGFRTAPAPSQGKPVRFVAFGDSGTGNSDQHAVYSQMRTVPYDFMVHMGDVGYGSGTSAELQQNFFDVYADTLQSFPVFPSSGNHEYNSADAMPYRMAFDLPTNGGPGNEERWYSFDWGDAHFVALDTERIGDVQARWLDADLAASKAPWKIVYGHRPPYSSGDHGSDGNFRKYFNPILEKHHVQLVLTGHDHHYERTKPMNGVTYFVSGGGGAGTRSAGVSDFTAFSDPVLNFLYVTIEGDTLTVHAIDGSGQEFDSAVIPRTGS